VRRLTRRARPSAASAHAHGAIKAYLLDYTICTRVQTISLDPYACVHTGGRPLHTRVRRGRVRAHNCTAHVRGHHPMCTVVDTGPCMYRTAVRNDSFAMHRSIYHLRVAPRRFWANLLNTKFRVEYMPRCFNYPSPKAHTDPKAPSSRWTTRGRDENPNCRPRGPPMKPCLYSALPRVTYTDSNWHHRETESANYRPGVHVPRGIPKTHC
jgi:hypothetical protein